MRAKLLAASFFALGLLFQPAAEASVVQLPLNGSVSLVSSGGPLTLGINDIQISGFPTFDLSNFGQFTFAYALIHADFDLLDAITGTSINSGSLDLEFDNCPFCPHPPVPHQLTFLVPVGQFELDITSSSEGHSNSGSTVLIGYGIFASSDVVAAVPEPSTWVMLLIGFAGLAFVSYRAKGAGGQLRHPFFKGHLQEFMIRVIPALLQKCRGRRGSRKFPRISTLVVSKLTRVRKPEAVVLAQIPTRH